jgi:YHS domain-containing protein
VADLSLAATAVGDQTVALAADMAHLRSLDISGTACTVKGLEALAGHEALEELRLTRTRLSDSAVETLRDLPSLKRVYLWNSGISLEAASTLHKENPALLVDAGRPAGAEPVETENAIKLSGDAPLPDGAPAQTSLTPVNTACPVSGAAVNPKYAIVHDGKVIGFCCEVCAGKFWADPEKYPLAKK